MPGDTCVFCGNSRQKDPSVSMHRFPRDPTLRGEWIKALRWLRTVHVWLLVRFTVLPLIYSCAGNTCGKLVNGHERGVVN